MNIASITSIVVILLSLQTTLLIVLLLQKGKQIQHRLLSVLLFCFLLTLINFGAFNLLLSEGFGDWIPYLQLELIYGFGPALYLYTKSLTDKSFQLQKLDWVHFLLPTLEFVYYRTSLFREGAIGLSEQPETPANLFYQVLQWGGLFSVVIYLSFSFYLLWRHKKWLKDRYSNLENKELSWLEKPIILYLSFCLLWIPTRIVDIVLFNELLRPYYFNLGFIGLAALTCWIGFKGYLTTHVNTTGFLQHKESPSPTGDESDLAAVAKRLQEVMQEKAYYLENDLSLASFSERTAFSQKDISRALNSCLRLNFHEFVNRYRVDAFKRNLEKASLSHLSLLGVAMESGFGSKSSFNLVFKSSTGMTPKKYKEQLIKNKS